ncbi:unnamed protein product [Taenia asiatica]|uniref:Uncharacterized protein n=1 Tax=Taenia asiatica TaxID=60517 RepID=A0A0R3W1W6_TAEAS|nr:unnamed protein product [Taenia asiatica]
MSLTTCSLCILLVICTVLVSTSSARPTSYNDIPNDTIYPRWRRPFFNPYPSWVSFLKQVYSHRHGIKDADQLDKRPFFNVFPHYHGENEHSGYEEA